MCTFVSCCRPSGPAFATRARAVTDAMTAMVPDILNAQQAIEDAAEHDICVICQDVMDVQPSVVTLACGHKFHGSCIVEPLYETTQCPICRNDPAARDPVWSDVDPEEEPEPRVLFHEALKKAKDDKKIARMFGTIRAHTNNRKEARKKLRELVAKMAPHHDALDKRIAANTQKAIDAHDKRHKKTLNAMSEARKVITKSRNQVFACKQRIAAKYGYVRIPHRSRVRSPYLSATEY